MKHLIWMMFLMLLSGATTTAQTPSASASGSNRQSVTVTRNDETINLQSGTQLVAELQNTIDARRAKAGQQVILKTTQAIKADKEVIVKKGAKLIGHITEVQHKSEAGAMASLSIVFDKLESGALRVPISATITSVTQAMTHTALSDSSLNSDTMASSSSRASTPSPSGGGLLGGVTQTVGGVLNTTTPAVGGVTSATADTVGRTSGALGSTLSGIQITQSSNATAEGNSTLSVTGGNLRLEKGTSLKLSLTEATEVSRQKRQKN